MLLPGELHHDSRLTFAPGPKGPGVFFFCSWPSTSGPGHSRLPEEHRPCRRADLRSRCTASEPPELAQPGDHAAGHSSRPPSIGKRTRRPGESGISHSQHQAKLADIRVTAARIAQAEGPERRRPDAEILIRYARRCLDGKYFLPGPCLQAVTPIGWSRIAVPSVSAALNSGAGG